MTNHPTEDSPGGTPSVRGPRQRREAPPSSAAGRDDTIPVTSSSRNTGASPVLPVHGDAPARTPAPAASLAGAGPQSPPARTARTTSTTRRADGDDLAAGEARLHEDASPVGLRGADALAAWKRAEAANNARQRNQRGRRPRDTQRPRPGMTRWTPPGGGPAA